jgi:hypothetical protein
MAQAETWTDADTLAVLVMKDEGFTLTEIASRFRVSRGAVSGLQKRIRDDMQAEDETLRPGELPAIKPENQDGGMPKDWWKLGLARQRGRK